MVAEADESDRSFLKLSPTTALVTNIDREHLEAYGGSFERVVDAFAAFADRVPFYGSVIACLDDPPLAAMLPRLTRRVITYGFDEAARVHGYGQTTDGHTSRCHVRYRIDEISDGTGSGDLVLSVPGLHNLQNALGATAVGLELGLPFDRIARALAEFQGAERRYQRRGHVRGVTVVDDYGHHPTEIAAVLKTARAGQPSRLVAVFQPHRYTRTRDLLDDFGRALSAADVVVLTDIYAAGEPPIPGVTLDALAAVVGRTAKELHVVAKVDELPSAVAGLAREGDLVVTLGAGSIGGIGDRIVAALEAPAMPGGAR
jgi:UDP-N-acetylmuramate--alanine ligase